MKPSADMNRRLEDWLCSNTEWKSKIVCACVYFLETCFAINFLGNSHVVAHPLIEKPISGTDTYLDPGRKMKTVTPANQQLYRHAL